MAARSGPGRLLERARGILVQELDISKVLPRLLRRGVFSVSEEKEILAPNTPQLRASVLLNILSARNDRTSFAEFCKTLEECSPHLLTLFVLDAHELSSELEENPPPTKALQLTYGLALKERDSALREIARVQEERNEAVGQLEQMKNERDQALDQLQTRHRKTARDKSTENSSDGSKLHRTPSQKMADKDKPMVIESDQAYEELRFTKTTPSFNNNIYGTSSIAMNMNNMGINHSSHTTTTRDRRNGANVVWETHPVTLRKAPTFGFGIAVSGGRDSPHFANGDPSVAISDVLTAGPAEGKLQINDRILTVNGVSLENVDHATAINVLRDCGSTVSMVVKRRILLPLSSLERNNLPSKIILSKKSKKDEFGLVLGVRFYVKEIAPHSLAAHERALKEGDTILKINNTPVEGLSLADARKILDKGKEKLQLLVSRDMGRDEHTIGMATQQPLNNSQDLPPPPSAREDVNIYRPSIRSEEDIYVKDPTSMRHPVPAGAYPVSQNTRFDGHYVLDNDLPHPRVPPPNAHSPDDRDIYPARRIDTRDNFYSDWDDLTSARDRIDREEPYPPGRHGVGFDEDVFSSPHSIHERYVDMRSDIRLEPRRVNFAKDRQTGLGLRLAGGNATGIFIASVQSGSYAEKEGLVEGDNILMANDKEITGLTREEAVAYLTSLDGNVSMIVQYRKEDYDTIMASHEAGDSFYIRTHFNYAATDNNTEHSFRVGDIFLVKDTLFRGVGGSWLAVRVTDDVSESKKGTIPNSKKAEILKSQQKEEGEKDPFPNRGKGSLFKRKSARRSKSLSKDHWEEVVFDMEDSGEAGLETKFPGYERILLQEVGFVRPVVIFGAISDIARERLLAEHPDRFEAPQMDKSADGKSKSAIIRLGAIRDAMANRKHCLLDVTPSNVDRLNYAQYCPIAIYLRADSKQAVKDVRSRWKTANKNLKKLQEYNEKLERSYSHLFTGVIHHMGTDAWFPRLVEMIDNQQQQRVWMSEKSPSEDISDEFMFPMSTRLSYAAGTDSDFELPRPKDDIDLNAGTKKPLLMRSSSDPSVNTQENIPGIPPYLSPPTYKNQRIPSHDSRMSESEPSPAFPPREDGLLHPEDRYYPSYYTDRAMDSRYAASRAHIDPYATLTPIERLRPRMQPDHFQGGYDQYGPYRDRIEERGDSSYPPNLSPDGRGGNPPYTSPSSSQPPPPHSVHFPGEQKGYADTSSHSSDSYSKYVSSPQNKHDDTKLREKFGTLPAMGSADKGKGHDPYRFTRSTANPVNATVDKAKLNDLTAKYRSRQDNNPGPKPSTLKSSGSDSKVPPPVPAKKKEPPPVPVKNYSLKQRGVEPDELKIRNYENSNRSYNYADVNQSSGATTSATATPPLPPPPSSSSMADYSPYNQQSPFHSDHDRPYEYVSVRQSQTNKNNDGSKTSGLSQPFQHSQHFQGSPNDFNNHPPTPSSSSLSFISHPYSSSHQQQQQPSHNMYNQLSGRPSAGGSGGGGSNIPSYPGPPPQPHNPYDSKAFANEVYMDHWDVNRTRSSHDLRDGEMGGVIDGARDNYMGQKGYRRPRTDDEQLRDLQYSRDRTRSETRLQEMSRQSQWPGEHPSRYDNNRGGNMMGQPRTANSRLGRDPNRSRDANQDIPGPHVSSHQYGSAFNAYRKPTSLYALHDPRSGVDPSTSSTSRPGENRRKGFSPGSELRKPLVISPKRPKDSTPQTFVIPPLPLPPPPPLPPPLPSVPEKSPVKGHLQNGKIKPSSKEAMKSSDAAKDSTTPMVSSKKTQAPSPPLPSPPSPKSPNTTSESTPHPPNDSLPTPEGVNDQSPKPVGDVPSSPVHSGSERGSSETPPTPDTVVGQNNSKTDNDMIEENHTVIATAKGIFTSMGGLLESPETGVSINIPEGAIEPGREQEIYFKVCRDNNLLPPLDTEKGETLLSPLVMCGPHGVNFLKPVELRLPHSASANPESWSFALKSSDAPTGETTEWQNMTLAGSEGTAKGKVNQDSVSIQVDHF